MPREFGRNQRVADLVQREVAAMIQSDVDQRHTGMVTISRVDVSPDLSNARIHFTCLAPKLDRGGLEKLLNGLAGQFRHRLSRRLVMRTTPRLQFVFDESVERGVRLYSLIDSLNRDKDDKS